MAWTTIASGWHIYSESPYYRGTNPFNIAQGTTASSVVYNGVTWTFDTDYTVGQFNDGSWWVIDPGTGVTVNSVSPAPSAGVNGSMLNPVSGGSQAFHTDADAYDAGLLVSFPVDLTANDALLSSVEYDALDDPDEWDGNDISGSTHVFVKEVGVLTVLSTAPPADAFRPGYCDPDKTIYTESDIVLANIPSIDTTGITAPSAGTFATAGERIARGCSRPWMLFCSNFSGRETHPTKHMKNYHQFVGEYLSELCCYVCTDYEDKDDAVNGLIQIGIDMYWAGITGSADSSFWITPIIMAGHFLNNSDMLKSAVTGDIGTDPDLYGTPRDYADFYFYEDRNDTTESSIVPAGQNYMNAAVDGRYVFFRNNLAANRGYEHLHPTEWNLTADGATTAGTDRGYRIDQDSQQHIGMAVAAGICNLWDEWNHPATQAYIERWMEVEDFTAERTLVGSGSTGESSSGNNFIDSMYTNHWVSYVNPL